MRIEKIHISKLRAAEYNPRVALKAGDKEYEKLKRSIQEFGFVEPIIWNSRTGNVVGGHQRFTVLRDLGETEIDSVIVDLDGQREKALNVTLNKVQGAWDSDKLAALLSDLEASSFDVTMTGFDAAEVDELLNAFYAKEAVEDNFDVDKSHAEVKAEGAVTKRGDIWQLGEHLLMCGDTTSAEDMARLMGCERAQAAVTSPPYGVGKEYERKGIEPWFEIIKPAIKNITKYAEVVVWNLGDLYSTGTQFIEPTSVYSVNLFAENGFRPIWIRIWKKQGINFGVGPYHLVTNKPAQQYEYITAFGQRDAAPDMNSAPAAPEYNDQEYAWVSAFAGHNFKFVKRLTKDERKKWGYAGIWEITTVRANNAHPAMFPVELPWRCVKMHSDKGGVILEPFSGSGTTIIACEQTGRKCRAMELTPEYCDVAIRRWEEHTSQKAILQT